MNARAGEVPTVRVFVQAEQLRRKVDDLEKLNDLNDRLTSATDTSGYEATIKDLRNRFVDQ